MDWYMDTLHLSNLPSSMTQPESDNTYLEDDYDHRGKTRKRHKFRAS
jgi:hypothetical protein